MKRPVLVDSGGIIVAALATPASVQDRAAFPRPLRQAPCVAPTIRHVWLNKGYTGQTVSDAAPKAGVTVDVVSGPKPKNGFAVQPADGWSNLPKAGSKLCRRLDRHYEVTLDAHEGFLVASQIAPLLRRLDRSQLFDTLQRPLLVSQQ